MDSPARTFIAVLAVAAVTLASLAAWTGLIWPAVAAVCVAVVIATVLFAVAPHHGEPVAWDTERTHAAPPADVGGSEPSAREDAAASPAPPSTPAATGAPLASAVAVTSTTAASPRTSSTASSRAPMAVPTVRAPVSPEPDDVLDALLDAARRAGMPVGAALWLADPATATVRRVAARGTPPAEDFERADRSIIGESIDAGGARFSRIAPERSGPTIWRLSVPILAGEAHGAATVDMTGSEPDRAALTAAVAALRSSLTGALALHVARVETRTAQTLVDAAHDLARLLDPSAVSRVALERAMRLSDAQTGSVMLLGDDGRLRIEASRGLPDDVADATDVGEGEGIAGWVLASGQHAVVEDLEGRGPQSRRHGIRSALSVPIADEDGILGVLNVGSRRMQARFTRSHVEALETLGRCTALALRNARASRTSHDLYFDTLRALALAMETKDPFSRGATERVLDVAETVGEAMGLRDEELEALRIAAMLHDIGMDAAGEGLSRANRPLTTVEWGMVKLHPMIAAEILEQAPALRDVVPIVYHHHENYDGSGYAAGIAGDRIPLGARILAVADAWSAMMTDRPYRPAKDADAALAELIERSGTQFDPLVVDAFVTLVRDGRIADTSSGADRTC